MWTTRATKDLEKITKFYIKLYGYSKARQIAIELRKSTEVLESENVDTSKIGAIDEAFIHLTELPKINRASLQNYVQRRENKNICSKSL